MMFGDPVEIRDVAEVFEQSNSDGAARHDNQDSKRAGYSRRQELSPVAQDAAAVIGYLPGGER